MQTGLSQRETARRIGVPETTYREWEYGRQIRGAEAYCKIAQAFEISISDLFGENSTEISLENRLDRIRADAAIIKEKLKSKK